jgi:surfactin synthase thioesterase subunit
MRPYIPSPWLIFYQPRSRARLRLFCFPFAGGAASIFRTWGDGLPEDIEVCAVLLPGREARVSEPLAREMDQIVRPLGEVISPFLNLPFAFFGHSMGASVAFELARHLRRRSGVEPAHFFASARRAPQFQSPAPMHALPRSSLVERLRLMGGTPEVVLQDEAMMQLFLPILCADLEVVETHGHIPGPPLRCPLTMIRGHADREVSDDEAMGWREHTSGAFTLRYLAAGHFFLGPHREQVLQWVAEALIAPRW